MSHDAIAPVRLDCRCLEGSERAPGIQRRRNGPIVRPKVDCRAIDHTGGFYKISTTAAAGTAMRLRST